MREGGINVVELDTHVLDRVRTAKIAQRNPKDKSRSPVVRLEDEVSVPLGPLNLECAQVIFPCRRLVKGCLPSSWISRVTMEWFVNWIFMLAPG